MNNNEVENYHRPNNLTRLGGFYNYSALPGFVKHQLLIITPARLALMDLVNNVGTCSVRAQLPVLDLA